MTRAEFGGIGTCMVMAGAAAGEIVLAQGCRIHRKKPCPSAGAALAGASRTPSCGLPGPSGCDECPRGAPGPLTTARRQCAVTRRDTPAYRTLQRAAFAYIAATLSLEDASCSPCRDLFPLSGHGLDGPLRTHLHRGKVTRAESPPLARLARLMAPPCASTMARVMARPSPLPPVSRLRDSSSR